MSIIINNEDGNIEISYSTIKTIAGVAVMEIPGVVGMTSVDMKSGLLELLKKENLQKGVKASGEVDSLIIEVYIIVEYGVNISEVGKNVQKKIVYALDTMTDLKCSAINVLVQDIRVQKNINDNI
ncbi:MAG: hypothetical protein K0R54_226 [Clostridiaceae bacterium]|nr:hypothetical protein [Clostridiaceae bacterium]